MRYVCGGCGRGFDVVAWLSTKSVAIPSVYPYSSYPNTTVPFHVEYSNYQTESVLAKPCCPFCGSLEVAFSEVGKDE